MCGVFVVGEVCCACSQVCCYPVCLMCVAWCM